MACSGLPSRARWKRWPVLWPNRLCAVVAGLIGGRIDLVQGRPGLDIAAFNEIALQDDAADLRANFGDTIRSGTAGRSVVMLRGSAFKVTTPTSGACWWAPCCWVSLSLHPVSTKLPESIRTAARGVNPVFVHRKTSSVRFQNDQWITSFKTHCCVNYMCVLWYIHSRMYVNHTPLNNNAMARKTKQQAQETRQQILDAAVRVL